MSPFFETIPRAGSPGAKKVVRFGRGETHSDRNNDDLRRRGEAALDLVQQVSESISATTTRIEARLIRALEQLNAAEERNCDLQKTVVQAEAEAAEAEKWLARVQEKMGSEFSPWVSSQDGGEADFSNAFTRVWEANRQTSTQPGA